MKKNNYKKIIAISFSMVFLLMLMYGNYIFALGGPLNESLLPREQTDTTSNVMGPIMKVYGTIYRIIQIIGVAGVAFTGVKYMYAGAEDKAQIKKTLIWLVVGVMFVFAVEPIINFVKGFGSEVLK